MWAKRALQLLEENHVAAQKVPQKVEKTRPSKNTALISTSDLKLHAEPVDGVDGEQGTGSQAKRSKEKVKCPRCKLKFAKVSNMKDHLRSAHEKRKYLCQFCSQDVTNKRSLQRHIDRKHKNEYSKERIDLAEREYVLNKKGKYVLSAEAKLVKLKRLTETIEANEKKIDELKILLDQITK